MRKLWFARAFSRDIWCGGIIHLDSRKKLNDHDIIEKKKTGNHERGVN
jgi:hypothetical protein